jgi:cardiolipin synthase
MTGFLTTPNLISLGRAVLGPMILILLASGYYWALVLSLLIVAVAIASDFFDGYLARKRGTADDIGRYLDGACDAIFNLGVFLGFLANGWLPASWFLLIYFAEIVVPYVGTFAKQIGQPFDVRWSTRLKTTVHPVAQFAMLGIALTAADRATAGDTMFGIAVLGAAVLASLICVVDHVGLAAWRTSELA